MAGPGSLARVLQRHGVNAADNPMNASNGSTWFIVSLERLWQDIRYGCRLLAASPGFAIISIVSLAIGIGANCAIFSFADALLLRPLPVARPGEVLTVGSTTSIESFGASALVSSYRDYVDIRDRSKSFDGLAAFTQVVTGFATDPTAVPKLKMGMLVSGNLLSLMGVEPAIGRNFRPEEDQVPGRDAVVILGRTLWEQEFGADPTVLGRHVRMNGDEFTVIGVAPPAFTGLDSFVRTDFFAPLMMSPRLINDPKVGSLETRDARNLRLKGRLKPGVSQSQAQAELNAIATDLQRAYPDTNKNRRLDVKTELQARMSQDPPDAMLIAMLSTLAFAVLIVACANVAGLLTSRAPVRAREMALRLAIGAGRGRLVRQLVTESLLIALAGGVLGLGIGYAGMMLFRQIQLPTDLPIQLAFKMDERALVFSLIAAVVSAVVCGLVPAIQASRADLTAVMKASDSVAPDRRRRWGRALLVGGQVAVSVVLLVIALFMYRGFGRQMSDGPGYRIDHLATMTVGPILIRYTETQSRQFYKDLADRAGMVRGVKSVTLTSSIPMANDMDAATVTPEGFQFPVGKDNVTMFSTNVDENYFDTLGIPIMEGRAFRVEDTSGAPRVAIVNERFAQHFWPNQDPIGKRFRTADDKDTWVQVVGLAKMSKYLFSAESPMDYVYFPYRQRKPERMVLVAQSAGDPAGMVAPLRDVIRTLDVNMPIYNVRTMEELYTMRAVKVFNVLITTVGAMGLMGLGLSIVGLYGLVAYAATRRTREIGIRMAIGAGRASVLRMVLAQGMQLAVVGLVVGVVASLGAGRLLAAAFPTGKDQSDFVSPLLVTPVVLAVTFLATYIPARQASRLNPMNALRHD
jgi:predicted permease